MSQPGGYTPPSLTAERGLTVVSAREVLYRWLWHRQRGKQLVTSPSQEPWHEELAWLGLGAEEAKKARAARVPAWLKRLPEILNAEPAPWGTGTAETSVAELRALGVLPEALVNFLALLGWRPPGGTSEILSRDALLRVFHPEQIVSTPVRFDAERLRALNHHWLRQTDRDRLLDLSLPYFLSAGYLPPEPAEPLRQWLAAVIQSVLPGLDFLSLLPQRTRFIFRYSAEQAVEFPDSRAALEREGARDVIREFGQRVLEDSWLTTERLGAILQEVRQATHRKGRAFLGPIRVMLTGLPFGPELNELVPIFETGSQFRLPQPVKSCRERVLEFCSFFV